MRWLLPLCLTLALPAHAVDPKPVEDGEAIEAPEADGETEVAVRVEGPLRYEGCPELDADVAERLRRYQSIRSASMRGFVGSGEGLYVQTRFGDVNQLHYVARPGGARKQLTFGAEPIASASPHPTESDQVLVRRDIGGNEAYQLWLLDTRTTELTLLTDGRSRHGGAVWSNDPARPNAFVFSTTARNGTDYDIHLGTIGSPGASTPLFEGEGYHYVADWDASHDVLLVGTYESRTRSHLSVLEDGSLRRLTPEGEVSAGSGILGPDGETAYVAMDTEGEFVQPFAIDIATGEAEALPFQVDWDLSDLAISPDGRWLAATFNENGWSRLYVMDLKKRRVTRPESLPPGMVGSLTFDPDQPRLLGLTHYGPDRPGDAWTLDVKKDAAVQWTASETAGLSPADLRPPEPFSWTSFDDLELQGFAYLPEGDGPFPVVVSIHGGPESQSRPYLSRLYQVLAAQGIAVVVPNVRGSAGYGKSFLKLDNADKREDSVKDIGTLLDWVAGEPRLDAERVAVRGGSYGGYMVLASLQNFNDRLVGGIDVVGISNFVTFLENTKAYRRDLRRAEYGDERDPKMREHLLAISPTSRVTNLVDPLMVVHGANDPRVPVSEAEQIVTAVRGNGQPVCYLRAENEGHGFKKQDNRDAYEVLSVQFLRELLLAESDEDEE